MQFLGMHRHKLCFVPNINTDPLNEIVVALIQASVSAVKSLVPDVEFDPLSPHMVLIPCISKTREH